MSKSTDDEKNTESQLSTAALKASLMGWSDKQGHILSGGGSTEKWYRSPRFPFSEQELPHHHLAGGSTHEAFEEWRRQETGQGAAIAGAWTRPLFVGGWTHSDDSSQDGETTFNLQTPTVFLDMRVPKAGVALLGHHQGFHTMTDFELRLFARRHAFAGYTRVQVLPRPAAGRGERQEVVAEKSQLVATRHHAIDWNYVGQPRARPNKWRVEIGPSADIWKEWGFAQDDFDQHVYMERWKRLPGGGGPYLALRRRFTTSPPSAPDAMMIVCGDHFGLLVDRSSKLLERRADAGAGGGLVGLVDDAVSRGDRREAVDFLSLEASHGKIRNFRAGLPPWTVDCSLHPWLEGRRPFLGSLMTISTCGTSISLEIRAVSSAAADTRAKKMRPGNPIEGEKQGKKYERDPRWWIGAPLDGVWDVVESTLPVGGPGALEQLLESSGAKIDVAGSGGGRQGDEGQRSPGFTRSML